LASIHEVYLRRIISAAAVSEIIFRNIDDGTGHRSKGGERDGGSFSHNKKQVDRNGDGVTVTDTQTMVKHIIGEVPSMDDIKNPKNGYSARSAEIQIAKIQRLYESLPGTKKLRKNSEKNSFFFEKTKNSIFLAFFLSSLIS
jgi:hypothetical protein